MQFNRSELETVLLQGKIKNILKKAVTIVWENIQSELNDLEKTKEIRQLQETLGISDIHLSAL